MYSNEQVSKLKARFWSIFGQYMKPIPGASGSAINWINYKTGIRNIHFKIDATNTKAFIAIEITHPQEADRLKSYSQFLSLKKILEATTNTHWRWNENLQKEHQTISIISQELNDVNIFNQPDWPAIISFLKSQIIMLDEFWEVVKDGFE